MTSEFRNLDQEGEVIIPLHVEDVSISKRRIVTGRMRISTVTREHEQQMEEPLTREVVEIERRPVGKRVESMPSIRQEGDTIIIPVIEEQLVIERRLILQEEVRVTRVRKIEKHRERVITRRQDVKVERLPAHESQEPRESQEADSADGKPERID
jgi:uncharacterized protein (TIGR02271 family)